MRKVVALALMLAAVSLSSMAQEEAGAGEGEVLLRFTSFGLPQNQKSFVVVAGESRSEGFNIPHNGFSDPVARPGKSRTLTLGLLDGEAPEAEAEPAFKRLLDFQLPERGKRFLVVVIPVEKKLRAVVVRGDDTSFSPGSIMIFNLSSETFAADFGGERVVFKKGSQTIYKPKKSRDFANYQVQLFMAEKGVPKRFAASLWPYLEKKRAYVFLYRDPETRKPSYRSVDEFTSWLAES